MNDIKRRDLVELIELFIYGKDRSLKLVNTIEVELDNMFPYDDEIQAYVTCFAMYRPGGGNYLYNEAQMIQKCICLTSLIKLKEND